MCSEVEISGVLPGWGCCRCMVYNGWQRATCKVCGLPPCKPVDLAALEQKTRELLSEEVFNKCYARERENGR